MRVSICIRSLCLGFACLLLSSFLAIAAEEESASSNHGAASAIPGPQVNVELVQGVPTFVMDEAPFTSPCFETYVPELKYFQQFAEAGTKLFMFNTNVAACDYGHSLATWTAPDVWNYSNFEERAERVLQANPNALLLLRVNLGTPRWWIDSNPSEWELLENGSALYDESSRSPTHPNAGPFPSLASQKWKADIGQALRRFIQHVQQSKYGPHIFGYVLTGLHTEEWYPWSAGIPQLSGYSPPTRIAFQEWLRKKYSSEAALQTAWNRRAITFQTVEIPTAEERRDDSNGTFRDPAKQMNVIDFYHFYNELIPDTINWFARIAREETAGKKVLGAFYAFMYEFGGNPEYGHNALAKYNESPDVDFVYVTASYSNREFARGGDYQRGPIFSVQLHDKLWYHDNDVISFLGRERLASAGMKSDAHWSRNLEHHLKVLGSTETAEQTKWMYRRGLGFCICNGAYFSYFDLHGGYYDDPELMREVTKLNRIAEVSKRYDRRSCSEILIVSDEESNAYASFNSNLLAHSLRDSQKEFIKIGAPQDHILLDDLDRIDSSRYKLIIFLNCFDINAQQHELITDKLKCDDKTLVWCYAPGLFDGPKQDIKQMQRITGMKIVSAADAKPMELSTTLLDSKSPFNRAMHEQGKDTLDVEQSGWGQCFHVEGGNVEKLGVATGTDLVTLARKRMGDWVSIYSWSPTLPASAWREIAREAGVHIFSEQDDTFYANANFLSIHANGAGTRTIQLPWKANVMDMTTEEVKWPNTEEFTYDFQNGETLILKWQPWL